MACTLKSNFTVQLGLDDLFREAGVRPEWKDLLRDLDRLQQVRLRHHGSDWLVRTDAPKVPIRRGPQI